VSKCGKYFLLSKKLVFNICKITYQKGEEINLQASHEGARQKCCSLGAKLLSIKSNAKRQCLAQLTKEHPETIGEYWTSGTDTGCDGNFRWCSVDRAFLKGHVNWAKSEPDRKRGDCVWTKTSKEEKNNLLYTENCKVKKKFICEVL